MKNFNKNFISFEGPECAGKTTQIEKLKQYFIKKNHKVLVTREPGGTILGEELRDIVKYHQNSKVSDKTEVLLFAASRAQLVNEKIKPALQSGSIVICDRFIDSTLAYQGYARNLDLQFINQLNQFAIDTCIPNITFLLDLTYEESMKRLQIRQDAKKMKIELKQNLLNFIKQLGMHF
jgi:dTMP kinase